MKLLILAIGLASLLNGAEAVAGAQVQLPPVPTPAIPQVTDAINQMPDASLFAHVLTVSGVDSAGDKNGPFLYLVGLDKTCTEAQRARLMSIADKAEALRYVNDHRLPGALSITVYPTGRVLAAYFAHQPKAGAHAEDVADGQSITLNTVGGRAVVLSAEGADVRIGQAKVAGNEAYPELNGTLVLLDHCGEL